MQVVTNAASPIAPATATGRSSPRRSGRVNPLTTVGPTRFVTAMGTGIVANAVTFAPVDGRVARGFASAVWIVAAAAVGGILPRLADGPGRDALLVAGYGLFGLGLGLGLVVITLIVLRIAVHGPGPTAAAPTVFIVLGPLGQSVTAACLLGTFARDIGPAPVGVALDGFATGFGTVVVAVAMAWLLVAVAIVAGAVRRGMPFALTWWSFTFPIGTCVTGTSLLAARVDVAAVEVLALTLLVALIVVWATVVVRTTLGVLRSGAVPRLLRAG